MTVANRPDYDARIDRAKYLAGEYPFAAEVLSFYQKLAGFQKAIYSEMEKTSASVRQKRSGSAMQESSEKECGVGEDDPLRRELDCAPLLENFPRLLTFLQGAAPQPIAEAARRLSSQDASAWDDRLTHFWRVSGRRRHLAEEMEGESTQVLEAFVLRAFLQPYVEFLAQDMPPSAEERPRHCPRCESAPLLGVLRPEGDGAKRCLVCSFCLGEWDFRRIFCAACGEHDEKKLPVYVAEQWPHLRIEACDTCKSYLRTIDLSKNGRAIPIVDDLAAIPLSLWAEARGYKRLQPNLLGT